MTTLLRVLAVLGLVTLLSACGGSGNSSDGTTTTAVPPPPPPPSSPPPPPPPPVTSSDAVPEPAPPYCPADGASAAVNSAVSIRMEKLIDRSTVSNRSISVRCGGQAVEGTVTVLDDTLIMTPASLLPAGSTCTAELDPTVRYVDGEVPPVSAWLFTTGETQASEWRFTDTRTILPAYAQLLDTAYRDGRLIVVRREASTLVVSVSVDDGESFQESRIDVFDDPSGAVVDNFDMVYRNGVLHLAWRVHHSTWGADIFYAHSTDTGLNSFSSPLLLTVPFDPLFTSHVSVETAEDGRVFVTWDEFCDSSLCTADQSGSYLATLSPKGAPTHFEQLTSYGHQGTQLLHQGGSLYAINIKGTATHDSALTLFSTAKVEVFDYDRGFSTLGTAGPEDRAIFRIEVEALPQNRALATWSLQHGNEWFEVYLARLDTERGEFSGHERKARIPAAGANLRCSVLNVNEAGEVSWLLGAADGVFVSTRPARVLSLSPDQGRTFDREVRLDFMGALNPSSYDVLTDELCPHIEVTENHLHAVWLRRVRDSMSNSFEWKIVNTRASMAAPCSRPDW